MKTLRLGEARDALYAKNGNGELIGIFAGKKRSRAKPNANSNIPIEGRRTDEELRLIPWREIWNSLSLARIRGHSGIVDTFFEVLMEESLFDDQGAWWEPSQVASRHRKEKAAA